MHCTSCPASRVSPCSAPKATGAGVLRTPEWDMDEHDKLVLLILCSDRLAPQIIETIRRSAHTGLPGDGLIAVSEVAQVIRIRTGEHGEDAV